LNFGEIVPNFARFLPYQISGVLSPQKVVPTLLAYLVLHHVAKCKVSWGYSHYPKVIGANSLNFKPIFGPNCKQILRETRVPGGVCAEKTWSFCSMCKNLAAQHPLQAEIWSLKKVDLSEYDSTSRSL